MKIKQILICTAVLAMTASVARADLITNGSFEINGPTANNAFFPGIGSTSITGWTVINNDGSTTDDNHNVIWIGNGAYGLNTPFGTDFLDLTGTSDSTPFSGVSQTVSTVVGQSYALSFDLGAQGSGGSYGGPISATASAGATSLTFVDPGTIGTPAGSVGSQTFWAPETLNFTATSASTVISFVGTTGVQFIGLDNVSLNSTVSAAPEPSIWALMIAGIGFMGTALRLGRRNGTIAVT